MKRFLNNILEELNETPELCFPIAIILTAITMGVLILIDKT